MAQDGLGNPLIGVRLPPELGIPLLRDAKKQKITVQAVMLRILSNHYSVESVPPRRGKPPKTPQD